MIKFFRRIRFDLMEQNKTAKYFKYAIGEIVLVVIGILIALQINNWNEARKTKHQELQYLDRLLSENKQDIDTFIVSINDLEKGKETAVSLSEALKSTTISDSLLVHRANEYFKYGSIYPIFSSSTSTFDDLSSTGNLKVISDPALREAIVKHYARHVQVSERIQIAVGWALPLDAPFTYENDIMKFEPNTAFLFPELSHTVLASELRIKKVTYISNAAAHYWINMDAISLLQTLSLETSELITKLETELKK